MTGRIAAVAVEAVAVVTLLVTFLDAVAAHGRTLLPAMVIAAVTVGAVAIVALLAAVDRAIAAHWLAVARRIATVPRRLVAVIARLARVDDVVAAGRCIGPRHDRHEEHAADDHELHPTRFSKRHTASPSPAQSHRFADARAARPALLLTDKAMALRFHAGGLRRCMDCALPSRQCARLPRRQAVTHLVAARCGR